MTGEERPRSRLQMDATHDGVETLKNPRSNAANAVSAAGARAFIAQTIQFYFRAPAKAFFRTRVDYLAYARSVQQQNQPSPLPPDFKATLTGSGTSPQTASRLSQIAEYIVRQARRTTPGVLASAIKHAGWRVVPDQILPPLIANVGVGAILYTSYLQILGRLHSDSAKASRRVYPPPSPTDTFAAGFLAGSLMSVVAAPLDAIQARFDVRDVLASSGKPNGIGSGGGKPARPPSMWAFSYGKLREIGLRGIFAGWGLSFLKDSFGSGIFFATFETVKSQGYLSFVQWYYGRMTLEQASKVAEAQSRNRRYGDIGIRGRVDGMLVVRPHYALEPAFLMLAGVTASVAQQVVLHPLTHLQVLHWDRLETLDAEARQFRASSTGTPSAASGSAASTTSSDSRSNASMDGKTATTTTPTQTQQHRFRMVRAYYHAYQATWAECGAEARAAGTSVTRWLFRGFWWNTVRQVPGTSAGLIIFELVRRRYGFGGEAVRLPAGATRDDGDNGFEILLD
jgi:hypothetical protein